MLINYYLITKPGILLGNLITFAAGFLLASKGTMYLELFVATMLGLAFIMASACVFNNYIDRNLDKKMTRTKNRALVQGIISNKQAITYAIILGLIGNLTLYYYTNLLTLSVASIGFFVYVILYSLWKSRTVYGTAIGSVAGAVPPIVGYCAVTNRLDLGALILFSMLVLWQMPHFFAIALEHLDDYKRANIPVLPLKKGIYRTKLHMLLYIVAFLFVSCMLTMFNYAGYYYFALTSALGLAWLALSLKGFNTNENKDWGKQMFRLSLILIITICLILPFDTV